MTTYYISPNGSDANNGLGPDASHASNKPWLTIGKALGASGFASADTVHVAPGSYREVVTVNMTSATVETFVLGDPGNAQGFKTSGGVLLAPGEIIWTGYTTNDTSAPAASTLLTLNGRDFLTFQYLTMVGGSANPNVVTASTTNSVNITFRECAFFPGSIGNVLINHTGLADIAGNWLFDRCIFLNTTSTALSPQFPTSASADYDVGWTIQNCFFLSDGGTAITVNPSGAGAFKAGGLDVLNCTMWGFSACLQTAGANISTSIPCTVYNCLLNSSAACLNANTSGQIVEDYNRIVASTPRTNVTVGTNSTSALVHALLLQLGQSVWNGTQLRPFFTPTPGSPLLAYGNKSGAPTVDFSNRPRPSGGGAAAATAATTGTATAGAGSTLTDGGASWTTNAFAGYTLKLTGGTGSGQQRIIASNTGTVATVGTAWATNPDNTSTYSIYQGGIDAGVGAFERHQIAKQETSVTQAGSNAIKITGPGDHDFTIPVDASATVISVYVRYDTNHGTGSKPQITLLANGEIGVTTETKTATVGVDTWEQLSFASQTPTAKGTVTVRCVSRSAAGNGLAYFDTAAGGATNSAGFDYFSRAEPFGALVAGGSGGGLLVNPGMSGGMSE